MIKKKLGLTVAIAQKLKTIFSLSHKIKLTDYF